LEDGSISDYREEISMAVAKSGFRKMARKLLSIPGIKSLLRRIPGFRKIYSPLWGIHPFDKELGIETSGIVSAEDIHPDKHLASLIGPYIGSQPSIVRKGLSALGAYEDYTFIDYGCGKGRVVVVAGEFPFQEVVGVELSAALAATARANAAKVALQFPDRPRINIIEANVSAFPLPPRMIACFNYHAFGPEIVAGIIRKFETALANHIRHMFFIYYNPVHFELFDASPAFRRFWAQQIPYDKSEIGFGPDGDDAIVIWQSVRGAIPAQHPGADRKIILTAPERAQLAD
jgi:SAM-dependent methyltransferase